MICINGLTVFRETRCLHHQFIRRDEHWVRLCKLRCFAEAQLGCIHSVELVEKFDHVVFFLICIILLPVDRSCKGCSIAI